MDYQLLGDSGLRVSELCLGTMTFGEEWGWGADRRQSREIFDRYAEAGGNFIDTANTYTDGTSERYLADFLEGDRDRFVVGTKYSLSDRPGDPNAGGNHRKNMVRSVEGSLRRLDTEYVDLLWLHAWDFATPVEEVMRGLQDLVQSGKVHYLGISDTPAWVISRANTLAELRGWSAFVGLQIEYNLVVRDAERDLLPMAEELGLSVTPWSPLAGGWLTGKYLEDPPEDARLRAEDATDYYREDERKEQIAREVVNVAEESGHTPAQVALAWLRDRDQSVIPILGVRRLEHLEDNLGALEVDLHPEHHQRLDEVSRIELGFPHDFLRRKDVRGWLFSGEQDRVKTD